MITYATEQPCMPQSTQMTMYAIEQPCILQSRITRLRQGNPTLPGPGGQSNQPVIGNYEIHVSFNNDMWWAMPPYLSEPILAAWNQGAQQVSFVWDWHGTRTGSYYLHGAPTSFNRYIIDFNTMQQRNIDNNRIRKVKVVCVVR